MGIFKRKKTAQYAQIDNEALQGLEDLKAVGLLAHLMSLPESWAVKKMHLYRTFGRAAVTNAVQELETKGYWVDITYRDGNKNFHCYQVSDIVFSDKEIAAVLQELREQGYTTLAISERYAHLLHTDPKQPQEEASSFAQLEVTDPRSSNAAAPDGQQINKDEETNREEKKHDNALTTSSLKARWIDACHQAYSDFAPARWSKKQWHALVDTYVTEVFEGKKYTRVPLQNIPSYVRASLKNIAHKHDVKYGRIELYPGRYNWLEG
ncbi:hypothetical protein [Alkalicoccus chagannorensis]|uniref:hypothetical protein n=1 Tax=Alkalicoccus chagannorensis TaxID=427072 RepID=UPI0004255592|nr:hypothetical protein [Alkalicoccus chagannorensis]